MPTTLTKTVTAYKFQELSDTAKSTACHNLLPDYEWWDDIYAHAKEDGVAKGFHIHNIVFTGFYLQGDGACWDGRVDMIKWLEVNKPQDAHAHILSALMENNWVDRYISISAHNYRYAHSNTMSRSDASISCEDEDDFLTRGMFAGANVRNLMQSLHDEYLNDISDEILDDARSYADDIYHKLRREFDYLCSEEHVAELCDMNEYLFDENGKLI